MSGINTPEGQVIKLILNQLASSNGKRTITDTDFRDNLSDVEPTIVNKEIERLKGKRVIEAKKDSMFTHPYNFSDIELTIKGWEEYAPLILGINIQDDRKTVSEYIQTHSPIEPKDIAAALDLSMLQVDFAIEHLESQRKITSGRRHEHPVRYTWIGV